MAIGVDIRKLALIKVQYIVSFEGLVIPFPSQEWTSLRERMDLLWRRDKNVRGFVSVLPFPVLE